VRYQTGSANRLGNRAANEDRCAVLQRGGSLLLLVADGMGGHARGDLAAQSFVDTFTEAFYRQRQPLADPAAFLRRNLESAHRAIVQCGQEQQPAIEPRTTAVACLIQGSKAWWIHAGDSRLYLLRGGKVVARTRDHTYVEDLYQHQAISEAEMMRHPMRNYVSRCLGGRGDPPAADADEGSLQFGDVVLLCSDGLWNAVDDKHIAAAAREDDLEAALDRLAERAEHASYPNSDNISVAATRLCADLDVDTAGPEDPIESTDETNDKEPVDDPIDAIRRAVRDYHHELDQD